MEFECKVTPTDDAVAVAAQTLGSKIERGSEAIENMPTGSLIDAIQITVAGRTLDARVLAEDELAKLKAEAAGKTALVNADNSMSEALIGMRLHERKLDRMPEIMAQMMKPVEKIESIKINQISSLGGQDSANSEPRAEGAFGSAIDQILGMAVRLPAM